MAFLNNSGLDIFLEIPVEPASKMFRPLSREPIQIRGHGFPTPETAAMVPGKGATVTRLRDYHFERCVAVDKRGTGCFCCNTTDPAWPLLGVKEQTNKKGHRVDFPKRPVYLLPVWSYTDNAIKILRGGNQVYENMDKWDTEGRDIRDCDWKVYKTGNAKTTKYFTSRQDSSTLAMQITEDQIKTAVADALNEYKATPAEQLMKMVAVMSPEEATQKFLESQTQQPMAGAPALPPGGFQGQPQLAAPTGPATDLSQLQAQLAALQAQLKAATVPATPAAAPTVSPTALGADIPLDQKAAAIPAAAAAPVAPVVPAPVTDPKSTVLEGGKYAGSTVGVVLEKDPEYLKFYRAYIKDETVKAYIDAALAAKPPVPAPTPAPVASSDAAPGASTPAATPDRQALVQEVRAMIDTFPELKGRGLGDTLVPFLKSVLGRYDYTESNVQDLMRLKHQLEARRTGSAAAA